MKSFPIKTRDTIFLAFGNMDFFIVSGLKLLEEIASYGL